MTWDRARVIKCVHAKGDPFTAAVFFHCMLFLYGGPRRPTPRPRRDADAATADARRATVRRARCWNPLSTRDAER